MPERYSPLPGEALVFRLVDKNTHFLPADAELPLPGWFEPSSSDVEEGKQRGRSPGLSVWNRQQATVDEVRQLVQRPSSLAFGLEAHACVEIGKQHCRPLAVVADPQDQLAPAPGWEAHALIEGLKRPPNTTRQAHKDLLSTLVRACQPCS